MTIRKTARFTVRPEHLEEAEAVIRTFLAQTETEPGTIRYWSWQSEGQPTSFLHLMEFVDGAAEEAHRSSQAVMAFTESLYPLCEETPSFQDWDAVT